MSLSIHQFQQFFMWIIIYQFLKITNPLQIIILIDIFLGLITKNLSHVLKHPLGQLLSNTGTGGQIRTTIALNEPNPQISINHQVPTQHYERVHPSFDLVVAARSGESDDTKNILHDLLELRLAVLLADLLRELFLTQHALVGPPALVLLHGVVGQVDLLVVVVDVEFNRWKSGIEFSVYPGHQRGGWGDYGPDT